MEKAPRDIFDRFSPSDDPLQTKIDEAMDAIDEAKAAFVYYKLETLQEWVAEWMEDACNMFEDLTGLVPDAGELRYCELDELYEQAKAERIRRERKNHAPS